MLRHHVRVGVVLLLFGVGGFRSGAEPPPQNLAASPAALVRQLNDAFAGVFAKVAPAVVVLEVRRSPEDGAAAGFGWDFFFRNQPPGNRTPRRGPRAEESEGSGFLIRADGHILTNAHVIEGADPVKGVVAKLRDGRRLPARIVGVDEKTDLAVLKVEGTDLPVAELGDSDAVRVGEFVCSIGAPFELPYTFTVGVVSAKGRGGLTNTMYEDYLQTDAAINPGNSGGPLCDVEGRVVGINTLINGISSGLGFAIPVNLAREVAEALMTDGRVVRPWLGIRIETLAEDPALQELAGTERGVLVRTVEPDTPAYRSSLQPADVVVAVDGVPVETARELQRQILGKKIGQTVKLKVWRRAGSGGGTLEVPVTTAELPSPERLAVRNPQPEEAGENEAAGPGGGDAAEETAAGQLGLQMVPVDAELAGRLKLGSTRGVVVKSVASGSAAALAGLQPGDVITGVGAREVGGLADFDEALAALPEGEGVVLLVERRGQKTYAVLKP